MSFPQSKLSPQTPVHLFVKSFLCFTATNADVLFPKKLKDARSYWSNFKNCLASIIKQ